MSDRVRFGLVGFGSGGRIFHAPLIASAILAATGSSTGISIYILICCVISMIALVLLPRGKESGGVTTV